MSLATAKADLKTALIALRDVEDEDYDTAIDDYLSALETWVKSAQVTLPTGSVNVTGTATAQSNAAPIVVNNALD